MRLRDIPAWVWIKPHQGDCYAGYVAVRRTGGWFCHGLNAEGGVFQTITPSIDVEVEEFVGARPLEENFGKIPTYVSGHSGSDPEVFVEHGDGSLFPAGQFLPNKEEAFATRYLRKTEHISSDDKNNFVYWDGLQAEMHTGARDCLAYHVDQVRMGLKLILEAARKKDPQAKLSIKNVVEVGRETLKELPQSQVAFGCKPSLNVYGLTGTFAGDPYEFPMRFAGGHYHFGCGQLFPKVAERVVAAADMIAGVPTVAMFQNLDNPIRRRFYGLPGEYRATSYGLEYRVLSNAWLVHPAVAHFTLGLLRLALKTGLMEQQGLWQYDPMEVQKIILEGDVDGARRHVRRNERVYRLMLEPYIRQAHSETYGTVGSGESIKKILDSSVDQLVNPVEVFVPGLDIETNWRLGNVIVSALDESKVFNWGTHSSSVGCQWQSLVLGR